MDYFLNIHKPKTLSTNLPCRQVIYSCIGCSSYLLQRKVIICQKFYKISLCNIVIRNGKIVWKHGPYCWYFSLNLKYLEYKAYIKTAKNDDSCLELLSKNDFEAVFVAFCCYDHGAKASEEVQKIATYEKEYRKCSVCVIICWIAKI